MTPGALSGTAAVVTGASSGIGRATARTLAAAGAAVAVVARRQDRLEALASEIRGNGGTVAVVPADVTDHEQAAAAVGRAVAELGRLDILVNNAGVSLRGPIAGAPVEEWDRMVATNLQGMLYMTGAALAHLVAAAGQDPRQVADIVNIGSTSGRVARPGNAVYSLTKFGVSAFTDGLRQEVRADNVRVGVVAPGTVETELHAHNRPEMRQATASRLAGVEQLRPEDVAEAIAYVVTRPRRMAVNEVLVRATDQTW